MIVICVPHAIFHDGSISVSQLVVLIDKFLLVGFPAFVGELFSFEKAGKFTGLVCLSESTFRKKAAFNL